KDVRHGGRREATSVSVEDDGNPAHRHEGGGRVQEGTAQDGEGAVEAAKEAYKWWRLVPAPKRGEILCRAARLLVERKETLAEEMTREMGKVLEETRGDVQEAIEIGRAHV